MVDEILDELSAFFKAMNLSTYEIDCYITLLKFGEMPARKITKESGVPIGRVYDVLIELKEKGLIEIQEEVWPKLYKPIQPSQASYNLVMRVYDQNKKQEKLLLEKAKKLERKLSKSKLGEQLESSKLFWSITYDTPSILSTYLNYFRELKEELLLTGFINKYTLKIIPWTKPLFEILSDALERGIKIKYLFSFEYDERTLTREIKNRCDNEFSGLKKKIDKVYSLDLNSVKYQMRYVYKKIPSYIDILDQKRAFIKLQNPMNPIAFFACINILDLHFATKVRKHYLNLWHLEAKE
ncbi:MAG: putative transcriptional regulator [Promethearchaeota archaeon]|nr:MAG: putative transcriptional regulator [Candidatus Lokiarchaeota archaeon]